LKKLIKRVKKKVPRTDRK